MLDRNTVSSGNGVLGNLFRPRSLAVVGASAKRGNARNTLLLVLLKHGFAGPIYPVNPSQSEIEGMKAYPSVEALPETPDLALIITPAETVQDIIRDCGKKGIPAAIVYSAGFEEVESGKERARELARVAKEHNVAVLGPNCQGLWSLKDRAVLSFSGAALALDKLTPAPIGLISQSGALSSAIGAYLQKTGIGCTYVASVGNETCIDILDVLQWMIEQDGIRVIALYLEGLSGAARIIPLAERARERGIQIVAVKTGRSAVGQKATASHTGKIASSHTVYADVLRQAGVILVRSLAEILAIVEVLGFLPDPRPSGDDKAGIAVLSASGGAGALLADHADEFGIPMAEFSPETEDQLEKILPEFAHKANPVDLTGQIYSIPNLFRDSCAALGADKRTEALVVQFAGGGRRNLQENGDVFRDAAREGGFPMILSFVADKSDSATQASLRDEGILIADDPAVTMRALSWLYERRTYSSRPKAEHRPTLPTRACPSTWDDIMQFCKEAGMAPAKWALLKPTEAAGTACAGLKYPVVVKVLPEDCAHKTELGLVKLRVQTAEEVDALANAFRDKLQNPGLNILVQEMIEDGIEVVLSCLWNADFGPIMSIGSGGVAIELYRDVAHLALPVSPHQVRDALKRLSLWTLLQGFRGKAAADIDALVNAAVKLGDIFLATPDLGEFEINPLMVRTAGKGIAAVDALVSKRA
jgi:acyl-CoA synthetase (NDP forming)